jgi:FkbM family methyltransferase
MPSLAEIARSKLRLAQLVRERSRFLLRTAAGRRTAAPYRLRDNGITVHLRHATPDLNTLEQVVAEGHYDLPREVDAALRSLGRPLEVVDLGANIGLFGALVLGRFPSAHVVAFEPDPENAAVHARSIEVNHGLRWELVCACAGTADGEVAFAAGDYANSRIAENGEDGVITVPVRDVFPYLRSVDLLKVDIEGAEWSLLSDMRFRRVPATVVALEFHPWGAPGDPRASATAALRGIGYDVRDAELSALEGHGMVWGVRAPAR